MAVPVAAGQMSSSWHEVQRQNGAGRGSVKLIRAVLNERSPPLKCNLDDAALPYP